MRPLAELTHYEILDLPPQAAPPEIRQAYKTALELYGEDSPVIYSLLASEERKEILARLEEAFATLINEETRHEYDQMLIRQGAMKEGTQYRSIRRNLIAPGYDRPSGAAFTPGKPRVGENPAVEAILSQEVLTGSDLKRLRTELGVSLDQISEWTRIRPGLLQCIEEDRFNGLPSRHYLRGFLKCYLQCLNLNPESMLERYMKRIQD
jgi:curved DNA-binding protein CbpA